MLRLVRKSVPMTMAAAMLLLVVGCASNDQTALQGRCDAGDQSACEQAPANSPSNPALNVTPGGIQMR